MGLVRQSAGEYSEAGIRRTEGLEVGRHVHDQVDGGLGRPVHRVGVLFFLLVVFLVFCHQERDDTRPDLLQGHGQHAPQPPVPLSDPVQVLLVLGTVGAEAHEVAVLQGRGTKHGENVILGWGKSTRVDEFGI